jgi:hypothetical protein
MLRLNRCIPIVIALGVIGVLNAGCKMQTTPHPAVTLTHPASQPILSPATVTSSPLPTRTGMQALASGSLPVATPSQTMAPSPVPSTPTPPQTCMPSPLPPTATATTTPTVAPGTTATRTPRLPTLLTSAVAPTTAPSLYRFLPTGAAQADPSHPCPGCPKAATYIVGRVVDAGGNPLAGVRLVCYNEWHRYPVVASKASGEYDFAIIQAETTWTVVVLDQADQPISPEIAVRFDPKETCRYILDWQGAD